MVKIEIPLPFKVPIRNGAIIMSNYKFEFFKVTFEHKKEKYKFEHDKEDKLYEFTLALVEYILLDSEKDKIDIKDLFHIAVVHSIRYLNQFIDALRHEMNIRILNNFTIKDLPELIIVTYKNTEYAYLIDAIEMIENKIEADDKEIEASLKTLINWSMYPNKEVIDKFYNKAKYHLAREDFMFAIIELQTSFEIFIRNAYSLILMKDKANKHEIDQSYKIPFRNLIEKNLSKKLNVNLNFKRSSEMKTWYDNLYSIRNKIVHGKMTYINGNTAYKAYDAYILVRNYINNLLIEKEYLPQDMKEDLKLFVKNSKENVDENKLLKEVIRKGIVSQNSKIIN
ncbi:HEPN domain-containing protein [Clostridium perfringens]|nr:HEPN domain-containing protein [Clostridium perfringens]MDM0483268.1 HEPN domain-containing protein [Clostridium perfringens]MDM0497124.1 HEPN domain-containing protein [Clostridium perfringens]